MISTTTQFLPLTERHDLYPAIDPAGVLKRSAEGKVIFISGASQGIGKAAAIAFARAGAKAVYIVARSEDALQMLKKDIMANNPSTQCEFMVCDVTDAKQVERAVRDCVARFGGLDVAYSCAGYLAKWRKIGESDPEDWWNTWTVNIKGTYHLIRFALPHLIVSAKTQTAIGQSGGHLILVSSIGAQMLTPHASDYQTTKHAINRLCEFVNVDHGDEGVTCFAIHPGGVATSLAKNMPEQLHRFLIDTPALSAGFVVWLCTGQADWARGRYLSCNWDVDELMAMKAQILQDELLVNRLRGAESTR
ncbi:SDR family oxidoreductase [Acerihabitans sp.]|uniref:SDR family NAD(P)-dependent oxidoreductase n=1 Tax=Acerihabitans sp. TaxID=2811394 RepID=UPI002ED7EC2F